MEEKGLELTYRRTSQKRVVGGARAHARCTATRASLLGEGAGTPRRTGTGAAGRGRAQGHQGTRAT